MVCAHGLTRNSFDYHWLATRLASPGGGCHTVLCFDTAGRASSEPLPDASAYGYAQYMADLETLLRHVGWDTVHWVGTSMGGIQGMLLSSSPAAPDGWRCRLASVTLVDIGPFVDEAPLEAIKAYVGAPLPEGRLAGMEGARAYVGKTFPGMLPMPSAERLTQCAAYLTRPSPPSASSGVATVLPEKGVAFPVAPADVDEDAPRAPAYDARIREPFDAPAATAAAASLRVMDLWAVWDAVRCDSVLVLHGNDSAVLTRETLRAMKARVPAGVKSGVVDTVSFEGVGHAPTLWCAEQEDAVVRAIRATPAECTPSETQTLAASPPDAATRTE